ncbi:hypothetical protein QMN07_20015, partial [Leptospira santarosai]|nr:hypothetical protein [Leptospira santarosai]
QGVAQTDEEKAHAARVEAEERARAAQNRNNSEQGASNISAAGVLTQRRDEDGAENEGRTNNGNGRGKNGEPLIDYGNGSYDNNYNRRSDVVGSQEAINRAQIETDPTKNNQHY